MIEQGISGGVVEVLGGHFDIVVSGRDYHRVALVGLGAVAIGRGWGEGGGWSVGGDLGRWMWGPRLTVRPCPVFWWVVGVWARGRRVTTTISSFPWVVGWVRCGW